MPRSARMPLAVTSTMPSIEPWPACRSSRKIAIRSRFSQRPVSFCRTRQYSEVSRPAIPMRASVNRGGFDYCAFAGRWRKMAQFGAIRKRCFPTGRPRSARGAYLVAVSQEVDRFGPKRDRKKRCLSPGSIIARRECPQMSPNVPPEKEVYARELRSSCTGGIVAHHLSE
jgi:hypothetical protein